MLRAYSARLESLAKRAAVALAPEWRCLVAVRDEGGDLREHSTGRLIPAEELEEVEKSGLIIVLPPAPGTAAYKEAMAAPISTISDLEALAPGRFLYTGIHGSLHISSKQ